MPLRNLAEADIDQILVMASRRKPPGEHFVDITEPLFRQIVMGDANFRPEGFYVFEESGRIAGFALCTYANPYTEKLADFYRRNAFLSLFYTAGSEDTPKAAEPLLECVERFALAAGRKAVLVHLYAPSSLYIGQCSDHEDLVGALQKHGYACDLGYEEEGYFRLDLTTYATPDDVKQTIDRLTEKGISFEKARSDRRMAELCLRNGKHGWYESLERTHSSGKCRECLIAESSGVLLGFCCISTAPLKGIPSTDRWGWGPVLVDRSRRKSGIGTALTALSLEHLQTLGLKATFLCTGAHNHYLYRRLGFRLIARFKQMIKNL